MSSSTPVRLTGRVMGLEVGDYGSTRVRVRLQVPVEPLDSDLTIALPTSDLGPSGLVLGGAVTITIEAK